MKNIIILISFMLIFPLKSKELTEEQKIVAMTILGEARGEGKAGQYGVACVIAERSIEWGKTLTQVCLKNNGKVWQFSCWSPNDPNRKKLPDLLKSPQAAYAKILAINITRLDRNFTANADHYCHINTNPYWAYKTIKRKGKTIKVLIKPTKVIGRHKFYKLR